MNLQLTQKTIKWLKPVIEEINTDDDIYAWHVNFQYAAGKRFVVLVHDLSRFSVVLYGIKKKEMLDSHFIFNATFHALLLCDFDEQVILKYLHGIPTKLRFAKTKNRKLIARMNMAVEYTLMFASDQGIDFDNIEQLHITKNFNEMLVGEDNYEIVYYPKEKMLEYLTML